jgi:hypothetical protein
MMHTNKSKASTKQAFNAAFWCFTLKIASNPLYVPDLTPNNTVYFT